MDTWRACNHNLRMRRLVGGATAVASSSARRRLSTLRASAGDRGELFIHPTAILEPGCRVGEHVHIGPYCVLGQHVTLADGVRLESHVRVAGHTTVGAGSTLHAFSTVGATPQDLKYEDEPSVLTLGERCRVAEYAHISGGTAAAGGGGTSIGDDCMIMSHCHVAHDCVLGERVLLASSAALAGHVHIGDGARISGYSCVHQKVSIGRGAFLGGGSVLAHDLLPHGLAVGNRAHLLGLNLVGLRRRAVPPLELRAMLAAYRYLFELPEQGFYKPLPLASLPTLHERAAACAAAPEYAAYPLLSEMNEFILGRRSVPPSEHRTAVVESAPVSRRALCRPP